MAEDLRGAVDDALRRLSPKSAMAKALSYSRKRWEALTRFLDDGIAEIDKNAAERAMRTIAIGRKNWHLLDRRPVVNAPPRSNHHRDLQAQWRRAAGIHR